MKSPDKILKKLTFKIWAGKSGDDDLNAGPVDITFIYGIGTDGLSDFERAVSDLALHESVQFSSESIRLGSYFGQLYCLLRQKLEHLDSGVAWTLRLKLVDCSEADPKEVVTAMAKLQKEGGCSSDCGCGCQ